jgi:hypothetical protein
MNTTASERVVVVLEDLQGAQAVLEFSCTLAQVTRRELQIIHVQSPVALAAAALPDTQALGPTATHWTALAPQDVERAWRAHAARLRTLAQRASQARRVSWSMHVERQTMLETLAVLGTDSDLLFIETPAAPFFSALGKGYVAQRIVALNDGTRTGERAESIAGQLAQALRARLDVLQHSPGQGMPAAVLGAALVVAPQGIVDVDGLSMVRAPVLIVGTGADDARLQAA